MSGPRVKQPLFWVENIISVKFHASALEFVTSATRCMQRGQWSHRTLTTSAKWAFLFASANFDNISRLPLLSQTSEWQQESTVLRMAQEEQSGKCENWPLCRCIIPSLSKLFGTVGFWFVEWGVWEGFWGWMLIYTLCFVRWRAHFHSSSFNASVYIIRGNQVYFKSFPNY